MLNNLTRFLAVVVAGVVLPVSAKPKILCLHGGGGTADGFRQYSMAALENSLPEFEFVYANGAYDNGRRLLLEQQRNLQKGDYGKDDFWGYDKDDQYNKDEKDEYVGIYEGKDDDGKNNWGGKDDDGKDNWGGKDDDGKDDWGGKDDDEGGKDEDDGKDDDGKGDDEGGGSNGGKLWIRDPPGGKGEPTTDPDFAIDSITALNAIVEAQGPFAGILGYSQGAAFVPVYLSRVPDGTFQFAVTFCGYPTETHQGILQNVELRSPFGNIPSLVWMGVNDNIIPNGLTRSMALFFNQPTIIVSQNGGHAVPDRSDSTFNNVVSIIRSYSTPATIQPLTALPTPNPTPLPTPNPTSLPTPLPTPNPTQLPNPSPTSNPTNAIQLTSMPTLPTPIVLRPTSSPTIIQISEPPIDVPVSEPSGNNRPKILCLHGGGGTGEFFRQYEMVDLERALPEFDFVYADGGYNVGRRKLQKNDEGKGDFEDGKEDYDDGKEDYDKGDGKDEWGDKDEEDGGKEDGGKEDGKDEMIGGSGKLWILDPPGGKGEPTTDPNFADASIDALNAIVEAQGPFAGILGFSQGAAFVPVYLSRVPVGTFDFAITFCGYPTETHVGILEVVERESPFGNIPSLVWMGENDGLIVNAFTQQMALFFNQPDIIVSPEGGHEVPGQADSTFSDIVSTIRNYATINPPTLPTPTTVAPPTVSTTLTPTKTSPNPTMSPVSSAPVVSLPTVSRKPKILCLHGGRGTALGFQQYGTIDLEIALPEFEFVFANGAYNAGDGSFLWMPDPPGGKGEPTTDPDVAIDSVRVLDAIVESQGPFAGILGYSQGAAFVPVYLSRAPAGTFEFALTFCGYPTSTHLGLLENVENQSPFDSIRSLVWMGSNDNIISNALTREMALFFDEPSIITSPNGGHVVPDVADSTFEQVVSFIRDFDTSESTPTTAPTDSSPIPAFCFPGNSIIEVQHKGFVSIKDIQVGDIVRVGKDRFEPIYAFGHYDTTILADYLKIDVSVSSPLSSSSSITTLSSLEISMDHMVFMEKGGKNHAVPASHLRVGDKLYMEQEEVSTMVYIQSIQRVKRQGAYAPFTPSGSIVVNQIKASTFISLQNNEYLEIGRKFSTGLTHQWIANSFEFPHRVWCNTFSCSSNKYDANGFSRWVANPYKFFTWWNSLQSMWLQLVIGIPILSYFIILGGFISLMNNIVICSLVATSIVLLLFFQKRVKIMPYTFRLSFPTLGICEKSKIF